MARTRKALHNNWDKNDPKDAQVILHMQQIGAVHIFQDPMMAGTNDIQELSKAQDAVSRCKTAVWHRIPTHDLPLCCPEADLFHRSSGTDWFLAFSGMVPSPHMISAMTKATWEVVGRKVETSLMLSDIFETAKVSAGRPVSPNSDAMRMFRLMLDKGRSWIRQRNAIEDRAVALLGDRPDYQRLHKTPGFGPINALTILAKTGDLRRFHHHRQFLKFCGRDRATFQSGMFRGHSNISRYGNARAGNTCCRYLVARMSRDLTP